MNSPVYAPKWFINVNAPDASTLSSLFLLQDLIEDFFVRVWFISSPGQPSYIFLLPLQWARVPLSLLTDKFWSSSSSTSLSNCSSVSLLIFLFSAFQSDALGSDRVLELGQSSWLSIPDSDGLPDSAWLLGMTTRTSGGRDREENMKLSWAERSVSATERENEDTNHHVLLAEEICKCISFLLMHNNKQVTESNHCIAHSLTDVIITTATILLGPPKWEHTYGFSWWTCPFVIQVSVMNSFPL